MRMNATTKTLASLAGAAMLLAAGCSRELNPEEVDVQKSFPLEFTAWTSELDYGQPGTRSYIDNLEIRWSEGTDHISVIDPAGANNNFTAAALEYDGHRAVFTGSVTKTGSTYLAVYPYDESNTGSVSAGSLSATLSAGQTIPAGLSTANGALLAVATVDDLSDIRFTNLFGVIEIPILRDDVVSVAIEGNHETVLAGKVSIQMGETPVITPVAGQSSARVTLTHESGVFPVGTYYASVLPGALEDGFRLIYTFSNGQMGALAWTGSDFSVPANGGLKVPEDASPSKSRGALVARNIAVSSSTATFEWSQNAYSNGSADTGRQYRWALYSDPGCTELVVAWSPMGDSFTKAADNTAALETRTPKFVFTGLDADTDYWFKVSDIGYKTVSAPVHVKTEAFEPVQISGTASVGDVILAEDFSEFLWNGDLINLAAGYTRSDRKTNIAKATGENLWSATTGPILVTTGNNSDNLFDGTNNKACVESRIANWTMRTQNGKSVAYIRPGHLKLGSSGKWCQIATPALSSIPSGKQATLEVKFLAADYQSAGRANDNTKGAVYVLSGDSVSSHISSGGTLTKVGSFDLNSDGSWKELTFTATGVSRTDKIVIGTDIESYADAGDATATVKARLYLDNISIKMLATYAPASYEHKSACWIVTSDRYKSDKNTWLNDNCFKAYRGEGTGVAYICSCAENTTAQRTNDGSNIALGNISIGDGMEFVWPNMTLAQGSSVEFMINVRPTSGSVPKYWLFEYYDNGAWRTVSEDLLTATDDGNTKYSFYAKYFSEYQYTTFAQNFTLSKALSNEDLRMRIRAVGSINGTGTALSPRTDAKLFILNYPSNGVRICTYQGCPAKDVKKTLFIGNSFTFYQATNFIFKHIARTQGHEIRLRAHTKGSQTFGMHLELQRTQAMISEGGYDLAFIQDQSTNHALYFNDPTTNADVLSNTLALKNSILTYSPAVNPIVLERTWAYRGDNSDYGGLFSSYEEFDDAIQGGALRVAESAGTWLSPIGVAVAKARAAGIAEDDLYYTTDYKHPGLGIAYLKACVNYLLVYGEPFNANVPDCYLDATLAAQLRAIATETVLGKLDIYRDPHPGIHTAEELLDFAARVNSGADYSTYTDASGNVVLANDIDMSGVSWTPIGSVTGTAYAAMPAPTVAFSGVFDGQGHSISNLSLSVSTNDVTCMGMFGATDGATIRNLNLTGATMTLNSTGISAGNLSVGTVVGYAKDTKISNVSVNASISGTMTSTAARNVGIGGIAGCVVSSTDDASTLTDCSFSGSITNDIGTKYSNTNSAVIGGIVAFIPKEDTNCKNVKLLRCTNNATIDAKAHRAGGIIANAFHCSVEGCINNGDITFSASADKSGTVAGCRVGGIMGYCTSTVANDYIIKNCENTGTLTVNEADSYTGGIAGIVRSYEFNGCKNRGNVYTSATGGLFMGYFSESSVAPVFTGCKVCGKVGTSASNATTATASNYFNLAAGDIASSAMTDNWNTSNIQFLSE